MGVYTVKFVLEVFTSTRNILELRAFFQPRSTSWVPSAMFYALFDFPHQDASIDHQDILVKLQKLTKTHNFGIPLHLQGAEVDKNLKIFKNYQTCYTRVIFSAGFKYDVNISLKIQFDSFKVETLSTDFHVLIQCQNEFLAKN